MRYVLICFCITTLSIANAANISSKSNGDWNNTNTWDCACIPSSADNVTIEHTITLSISTTVQELRFSTEWSPNFGHGSLTISSGTLTVTQGTISFGNNGQSTHSLSILSGATLSATNADIQWLQGASISVNGTLTANNFDVANGNGGNFIVATSGVVEFGGIVSMSSGPHSFDIDGTFQSSGLNASGSTELNVSGTGNVLLDGDVNVTGGGEINVDGGTLGVSGNINSANDNSVNVTNGGTVTAGSCSGFCDSDDDITLPVVLLHFDVNNNNGLVELEWSTGSELDNDYFMIEKSRDGQEFFLLDKIQGKGTSASLSTYLWVDNHLSSGLAYYRLSQVDYDGSLEHLSLKSVNISETRSQFSIYPNSLVVGQYLNFKGIVPEQISIVNQSGQVVLDAPVFSSRIQIIDPLPRGLYFLEARFGHHSEIRRLLIE